MTTPIGNLRKRAGLTQVQLADQLKVDNTTVSKWESGKSFPRKELVPILAHALGCGIEELYQKEGERT